MTVIHTVKTNQYRGVLEWSLEVDDDGDLTLYCSSDKLRGVPVISIDRDGWLERYCDKETLEEILLETNDKGQIRLQGEKKNG